MAKRQPSIGRQKIKIEKILKKNHLQVTFSKRRAGLFKKASELCTLCGVEIAITVFSPANKAFSFGHPDVESVIDRFLARNPSRDSGAYRLFEAHRNANVRDLNVQLTHALNQLEAERKHGEALNHIRKAGQQSQRWWEAPIEDLGFQELDQLRSALEELRQKVTEEANKMLIESANSLPFFTQHGILPVEHIETKPEICTASGITRLNDFGYGHGIF